MITRKLLPRVSLAAVAAVAVFLTVAAPASMHAQGTLYVEDDKVGVGIATPVDSLHVFGGTLRVERGDGVTPNIRFLTSGGAVTQNWLFQNNATSGVFAIRDVTAGNSPFRVFPGGSEGTLTLRQGRVGIGTNSPIGALDVNGAIYQRGSLLHADYVFEAGYELESIEEHSTAMWSFKHLPAVPGVEVDESGQQIIEVGSHRRGMLEELEKAHIYIARLNEELKAKDQTVDVLAQRLARLEERLAAVENDSR